MAKPNIKVIISVGKERKKLPLSEYGGMETYASQKAKVKHEKTEGKSKEKAEKKLAKKK